METDTKEEAAKGVGGRGEEGEETIGEFKSMVLKEPTGEEEEEVVGESRSMVSVGLAIGSGITMEEASMEESTSFARKGGGGKGGRGPKVPSKPLERPCFLLSNSVIATFMLSEKVRL